MTWRRVALTLVFLVHMSQTTAPFAQLVLPQISIPELTQAMNRDCIGIQVIGVCTCSGQAPDCVVVSYYVPTHMVVVTKHPNHNLLGGDIRALIVNTEVPGGLNFPLGGSGGVKTGTPGSRTHHFWDARVYSVPSILFQASSPTALTTTCLCQTDTQPGLLHYDSRLDAGWRRDDPSAIRQFLDLNPLGGPLGIWGRLSPVNGFIVQLSESAAAAAIATRAMHAVINPLHGREIALPAVPGSERCIQPAWPLQKPCIRPGTNPVQWEYNALGRSQSALFFFWSLRTCCVEPDQLACATAAGVVGPGVENFCPLPLLPGGLAPGLLPNPAHLIPMPGLP